MNKEQYEFINDVLILLASNIPFDVAEFIACQFALESNYGKSNLAKENHNYCGMKNPLVRISFALHAGDSNYHWAQYGSLALCVFDYLLCISYHRPLSTDYDTIDHYGKFISKFYCLEKDYISKINSILSQFKSFQNGN